MNKTELLSQITEFARKGVVSLEEVTNAYTQGSGEVEVGVSKPTAQSHSIIPHIKISDVLYLLGGMIIFIGVSLYISQHWTEFNSITRILTTLGVGYAAYFTAVFLGREKKYEGASNAFHFLSCLVIPTGVFVAGHEAGLDVYSLWMQTVLTGVICLQYLLSFFLFKRTIILVFLIGSLSTFFIVFTNFLINDPNLDAHFHFSAYRLMAIGISYLFLTDFLAKSRYNFISGLASGVGTLFILFAMELLFPWEKDKTGIWEFLIPVGIVCLIYTSTFLQSKSCLYFTSFYLIVYILQITNKYFADSIGWPLAIIGCGFMTIVVGYFSFTVGKKMNRLPSV